MSHVSIRKRHKINRCKATDHQQTVSVLLSVDQFTKHQLIFWVICHRTSCRSTSWSTTLWRFWINTSAEWWVHVWDSVMLCCSCVRPVLTRGVFVSQQSELDVSFMNHLVLFTPQSSFQLLKSNWFLALTFTLFLDSTSSSDHVQPGSSPRHPGRDDPERSHCGDKQEPDPRSARRARQDDGRPRRKVMMQQVETENCSRITE